MKIHTMFPGINTSSIANNQSHLFTLANYVSSDVAIYMSTLNGGTPTPQTHNQTVYFRILDLNGEPIATSNAPIVSSTPDNPILGTTSVVPEITTMTPSTILNGTYISTLYPYILDSSTFVIADGKTFYTLAPGETITIPLLFYYGFAGFAATVPQAITKIFSFDIRTSLYQEPTNYTCKIIANYNNKTYNRIIRSSANINTDMVYDSAVNSSINDASATLMASNANLMTIN